MRKLLLALVCLAFMTGVVVAADVVLVKFDGDKKELTVKEGDKESTYKITDKTKVSFVDKDGNAKEGTLEAATKILSNPKAAGKLKFELTAADGAVSELKLKGGKKKN